MPLAVSRTGDFTAGAFREVIDGAGNPETVRRILLCSGKIYYDLMSSKKMSDRVALVRVEQFYPYPGEQLAAVLARYTHATEIAWTQEEPLNMGGWSFMQPRLVELVKNNQKLLVIGRPAAASPASGSLKIHQREQEEILSRALDLA